MVKTLSITDDPKKGHAKPDLTAGPGHNVDRDAVLFLAGQLSEVRTRKAAVAKEESGLKKKIINCGVAMGIFDEVLRCLEEGPDAVFERLSQFKLYAGWFDLPVGAQLQLFENPKEGAAVSHETLLKRAEEAGYMLGVMAKPHDDQAYHPESDLGQAHQRGYARGQKVQTERFMALNEEKEAEKKQAKADADATERKKVEKAEADKKKAESKEAARKHREDTKAANAKAVADLKAKKAADKAAKAKKKTGNGEQPAAH